MTSIAIIPARGGSKRIPKKNIKAFLGTPIIAYSIQTALDSNLFDRVIVSTDSEEISNIARDLGAEVPFVRSKKNSDDFAGTASVLNEVFDELKKENYSYDYGCCIYPTAPFTTSADLRKGLEIMNTKNVQTVFSAVEFDYPIWRSLKIDQHKAIMNWPEFLNSRSQDLPHAYHDAGQWYWYHAEKLKESNALFTENSGVVLLPKEKVQDIDTASDWKIAEMKYQLLQDSNS